MTSAKCPICAEGDCSVYSATVVDQRLIIKIACNCCGEFRLTKPARTMTEKWHPTVIDRTVIARQIRRMSERDEPPLITSQLLMAILEDAKLPYPDELLDDFVLWMGSNSRWPGDSKRVIYPEFKAVLGSVNEDAFAEALQWVKNSGYFQYGNSNPYCLDPSSLAPTGWRRFNDLRTARTKSRHAFIAMRFDDPQPDDVVKNHFIPAARSAGFELRPLNHKQPAGLIDNQLRLAICTARFAVCDPSHGNRGVYWEAGYAEALGKPVIFTCRKDVLDDKSHEHHPHFDTNHQKIIKWDPDHLAVAAEELKATIRVTLPVEAKLED